MIKIAENHYDELLELERKLCGIPAPSGMEEKRAEFCLNYLKDSGAENVYIDEAKNVVCILGEVSEDMTAFFAHTDTVFPGLEPMELSEDDEKIYCPGACDDTASLTMMLMCIRFLLRKKILPSKGIIFVANSCEEGLGNLKGCRQIFKDFEGKIKRMYSFDGNIESVVNTSVGSHRYRVTAKTEGGHSFAHFGNRNAISVISRIVNEIYKIDVPVTDGSKTTYNVGGIGGGTSVNTIAQEAYMLCEYRSDNVQCLDIMKNKFAEIFKCAEKDCSELIIELVGERPCMKNVDMDRQTEMSENVRRIQQKYALSPVPFQSGSTDCNIPHSLGIPAVCVGVYNGGGEHTREEWLEKRSLKPGMAVCLELILQEMGVTL